MSSKFILIFCWINSIYNNVYTNTEVDQPVQHRIGQKFLRLLDNSLIFNVTKAKAKQLPIDGTEKIVFGDSNGIAHVFFEIEHEGLPLSLLVEPPCGEVIEWTVNLLEYAGTWQEWRAVDVRKPSSEFKSKPNSPSYVHVRHVDSKDREIELADYQTDEAATFNLQSAPRGLYIIKLKAKSKDKVKSEIKLAASLDNQYDLQLPKMPVDKQVVVAQINVKIMNLYWKPAALNDGHSRENSAGKTRYCVVVNMNKNPKHLCEVQSIRNETKSGLIKYQCFYGQHHFQLTDVIGSHHTYSINVFAVNPISNRSLPYKGLVIPAYSTSVTNEIKENQVLRSKIKKRVGYRVLFFENRRPNAMLKFAIVICDGTTTVMVSKDGKVIQSRDIQDVDTFSVRNSETGRYIITITSHGERNVHFRAFVSSINRRHPFPNLPKGRVIREWPMLRTCHSIAIAWVGVHGKQQYCLYGKQASRKPHNRTGSICLNSEFFQRTNKIVCLYKRLRRLETSVFTWTVKGLESCMTYNFHVQVKRKKSSQTLSYRNLRISTRCDCSN